MRVPLILGVVGTPPIPRFEESNPWRGMSPPPCMWWLLLLTPRFKGFPPGGASLLDHGVVQAAPVTMVPGVPPPQVRVPSTLGVVGAAPDTQVPGVPCGRV